MEVSVSHSYHNGGVRIFMVFPKAILQTTVKVSNGEPLEKESTRNSTKASGLVHSVQSYAAMHCPYLIIKILMTCMYCKEESEFTYEMIKLLQMAEAQHSRSLPATRECSNVTLDY